MAEQQSAAMSLAPSQTLTSNNGNTPNPNRKRRNRGKSKPESGAETPAVAVANKASAPAAANDSNKPPAAAGKAKKNRQRNNKNKKESSKKEPADTPSKKQPAAKKRNNKNERKRFPWRRHLPTDSVDPITLETLESLTYPPFALVASEPYDPVPEWPVPEASAPPKLALSEEDRQRQIIREQWGHKLSDDEKEKDDDTTARDLEIRQRHYNLFDGRALAYYMVSQLQFIDPLNRRDLTRDELVNLDRYLRRHQFTDLNVTEAYDAKGVTISTAGAAANTAAGQAAILQQLAGNLLSGLFGGGTSVASRPQPSAAYQSTNRLMAQYQAHEAQNHSGRQNSNDTRRGGNGGTTFPEDVGIYGDSGILIIDDDMNPGLRGNAPTFVPITDGGTRSTGPNALWSASHIASRYGHAALVQQDNFPALAVTAPVAAVASEARPEPVKKKPAPSSKTLSRITKTVKKTSPEELQKQWEAREDARRKAALSQLTFGGNMAAWETETNQEIPSTITTSTDAFVSEGQLERNRAFAQALGVAPATVRGNINAGWARPTGAAIEMDEFGNELNATVYPDALIMKVRERIGPLLKLERKWKNFLDDDKAASLPLNYMDKPMRKSVHEYSDYWKLQTESFDAEPKRYIHCVKLRDTCAPYPLLSDAARNWRGPRPVLQSTSFAASDHPSRQTAGQTTRGRDLPAPPERVPLSLKPRSATTDPDAIESLPPGIAISGAPTRTMTESDAELESRFGALAVGRERAKLELSKRTVPLELPPYEEASKGFDFSEEVQRQKERVELKALKEREREENKQRALEAAFASSDEEEVANGVAGGDDSEWSEEEQEPMYAGGDEDEE